MFNLRQRATLQTNNYISVPFDEYGYRIKISKLQQLHKLCKSIISYKTVQLISILSIVSTISLATLYYMLYQYIPSMTNNFSTNQTVLYARSMCYNDVNCRLDSISLAVLPFIWRNIILPIPKLREYVMTQWFHSPNTIHIGQINSRVVFYDNTVNELVQHHHVEQIVIMGSGYDTRYVT